MISIYIIVISIWVLIGWIFASLYEWYARSNIHKYREPPRDTKITNILFVFISGFIGPFMIAAFFVEFGHHLSLSKFNITVIPNKNKRSDY